MIKRGIIVLISIIFLGFFIGILPAQDNDDNDSNESNSNEFNKDGNNSNSRFSFSLMPYISYSSQLLVNGTTSNFDEYGMPTSKFILQFISPGYNIGLDMEIPFGSFFSLGYGVRYDLNSYGWFEWNLSLDQPSYILSESIYLPVYGKVRYYQEYWMPFAILGLDFGFNINTLAWVLDHYDSDDNLQESGFRVFGDSEMTFRLGLIIGGGITLDIGISTLDIKLLYSIGLNKDLRDSSYFKYLGETSRNFLIFSVGWRFMIGNRRDYMPYGYHSPIDILNIPPKISLYKSYIERKTIEKGIENRIKINNYEEIYVYLKNLRLKILDVYGNEIINQPYSIDEDVIIFEINDDTNFRSFEDYDVILEATFIDNEVRQSKPVVFSTGIIFNIDEYGYKTIATTSFEFNDDGSVTETTMDLIIEIIDFIINLSSDKIISELNVGIEGFIDDSINKSKVNQMQKLLNEYNINDYVESLFVFIDVNNNDDSVPNLVKFDMQFSGQ